MNTRLIPDFLCKDQSQLLTCTNPSLAVFCFVCRRMLSQYVTDKTFSMIASYQHENEIMDQHERNIEQDPQRALFGNCKAQCTKGYKEKRGHCHVAGEQEGRVGVSDGRLVNIPLINTIPAPILCFRRSGPR